MNGDAKIFSRNAAIATLALAGIALLVFLAGALTQGSLRVWQAYLVNWIFWSGMAQGGVVFAAIIEVTDSKWGRPMKRLAETFGAFLPLSFVLFLLLWPGMTYLYPWIENPVPGKEAWLARGFMYGRDALALLVLYGISFVYMYCSVRPDMDAASAGRAVSVRKKLAAAVIIVYGLVYSLLGFDLVMSLDPTWYSTLFGAYIFIVNVFSALAMVAAASVFLRNNPALRGALGESQFHDLGKLLFGFCLLTLDFFWSQFLVIWYGNMPEETGYVIIRAFGEPWMKISWFVLFGGFVLPFILLISRRMKSEPRRLAAVSIWILAMVWLERFILVAPSTWPGDDLPLGATELVVTAGFAALFIFSSGVMLNRVPALPVSDPIFIETGNADER